MAEIKIRKKRAAWPWILGCAVLAAAILYFIFVDNRDDQTAGIIDRDTTTAVGADVPGRETNAVAAYISFIRSDTDPMDLDHNYTNEALSKLIRATEVKADQLGYEVKADLDQARSLADKIQQEQSATTHAGSIRSAADIISKSLQNMQQAHYPDLDNEAGGVSNAAADIDPAELTLEQKKEIKAFFREAADLLDKMDEDKNNRQNETELINK